jgi:hypothetical protein
MGSLPKLDPVKISSEAPVVQEIRILVLIDFIPSFSQLSLESDPLNGRTTQCDMRCGTPRPGDAGGRVSSSLSMLSVLPVRPPRARAASHPQQLFWVI